MWPEVKMPPAPPAVQSAHVRHTKHLRHFRKSPFHGWPTVSRSARIVRFAHTYVSARRG